MKQKILNYIKTWSAADVLFVLFGGLAVFIGFNLFTENAAFLSFFTPGVQVILFIAFALICIGLLIIWHARKNAKQEENKKQGRK